MNLTMNVYGIAEARLIDYRQIHELSLHYIRKFPKCGVACVESILWLSARPGDRNSGVFFLLDLHATLHHGNCVCRQLFPVLVGREGEAFCEQLLEHYLHLIVTLGIPGLSGLAAISNLSESAHAGAPTTCFGCMS